MRKLLLFEDFKKNNDEGTLITQDDVINCIKKGGLIYTDIVHELPDNPSTGIKAVDIDEDGLITVEVDGKSYTVDLQDVKKIEY
jgi:hypothetical protein